MASGQTCGGNWERPCRASRPTTSSPATTCSTASITSAAEAGSNGRSAWERNWQPCCARNTCLTASPPWFRRILTQARSIPAQRYHRPPGQPGRVPREHLARLPQWHRTRGGTGWQGDGIQLAFSVPGHDGYWEVALTQLADGKPEVCLWQRAKGFPDPTSQIVLTTTTQPGGLRYEAKLPLAAFDLAPEPLQAGFSLSFLVNDNDGEGRESWIELSDGIGRSKDPRRFP